MTIFTDEERVQVLALAQALREAEGRYPRVEFAYVKVDEDGDITCCALGSVMPKDVIEEAIACEGHVNIFGRDYIRKTYPVTTKSCNGTNGYRIRTEIEIKSDNGYTNTQIAEWLEGLVKDER